MKRRAARPAARAAGRDQGHHADGRHPHDLRFAALRGLCAGGGRRSRAPPQGGGRDRPRQDQHAGIRLRRLYRQCAVRSRRAIRGIRAESGGIVRRLGGRRRNRHGADRARHRFRRLDPHSGRLLRHRRHSADAGPCSQLSDAARLGSRAGPWRPGARRRGCALMLDAMVGFSRLSPISVAPPWQERARRSGTPRRRQELRVAYAPDIAGHRRRCRSRRICRKAALRLRDAGAIVEEIDFDVADGRAPIRRGAACGWSASNTSA